MEPSNSVTPRSELVLSGRGISPELAIGPAWVVGDVLLCSGPVVPIVEIQVDGEVARLARSFEETLAELDEYARRIEAEFDATLAGIFRAHGQMLRELFASGEFQRELRGSLLTAEAVVQRVLLRWHEKFQELKDQGFRQRADDLLDLGRGMIRSLRGQQQTGLAAMPEGSVLVVEQLLPSDVVALTKSKVAAVARDDASVNGYYIDSHESVLRLLEVILADAGQRPVSLCGELAGRDAYVPRLVSMGFHALSMAPTSIPATKALIRTLNSA